METLKLFEKAAVPLSGVSAGLFGALSGLRRARIFHPEGSAFSGTLKFTKDADAWVPSLSTNRRERKAIVRLSRGAGLPGRFPDILGLAIKLPDAIGDGADQDWLLVTSGRDPVTRHALIPSLDFKTRPYSTVLPYKFGDRLVTFGAFPLGRHTAARTIADIEHDVHNGGLAFDFTVAPQAEDHIAIGSLKVTATLPQSVSGELRFNPWNCIPELRPAGALNELRRASYLSSQIARPDTSR